MTKYYRVIKDHPIWEVGAILEHTGSNYKPIEDFWNKVEGCEDYGDGETLVENQPEFYERVYPLGKLEKKLFGTKKQAQAAAAALYKGDK